MQIASPRDIMLPFRRYYGRKLVALKLFSKVLSDDSFSERYESKFGRSRVAPVIPRRVL